MARTGLSGLVRGRLILTAHSGGGAALLRVLENGAHDPDEIYIFDGLYTAQPTTLINWAATRISRDLSALNGGSITYPARSLREQGGALCVLYVPCFKNRHGQNTECRN